MMEENAARGAVAEDGAPVTATAEEATDVTVFLALYQAATGF
jgi:hypothetical protein